MIKQISEAISPVIASGKLKRFIDKGKLIQTAIETNEGEALISIRKSNGSTAILGYKDAFGRNHWFGFCEATAFDITDSENVVETIESNLAILKADRKAAQELEQDQAAHRE